MVESVGDRPTATAKFLAQFGVSGPVCSCPDTPEHFVRRRYLETLYLPDVDLSSSDPKRADSVQVFSSIVGFVTDLYRTDPSGITSLPGSYVKNLLLSLPEIEARHRKTLRPILSALMSSSVGDIQQGFQAAVNGEGANVEPVELEVVRTSVRLRTECRKASEGATTSDARRLNDEFERRETLMQVVILMVYLLHDPRSAPKKRKRDRRRGDTSPAIISPHEDPEAAMELLLDRLSVWQALAELGIGLSESGVKTKGKAEEDGMQTNLRRFWEQVIVTFFLPKLPELAASFHLKVFGQPIPPKMLPLLPASKKPRKPKLTRAIPSLDAAPLTEIRPASRPPSEKDSPPPGRPFKRPVSRNSETLPPDHTRRSRSNSIDPVAIRSDTTNSGMHRSMIRAPSGKNLFLGREMSLLRRTSSVAPRKESLGGETQRLGLLGRKTSDGYKERRNSVEESRRPQESQSGKPCDTIIFATPSKPRSANAIFGPRVTAQVHHPAPIQEEAVSVMRPRPSYIAETPLGPGRMVDVPLSALASGDEDDDDDPLADLMVMTDEEDEDAGRPMVPDTPAR